MSEAPTPSAATVAVTVPVWTAAVALAVFSLLDLVNLTPFSDGPLRNVAEAAAAGNAAEVLRRINAGEDLRQTVSVRSQLISSSVRYAAALEAAVWSRQGALVRLLDRLGTIGNGGTRRHLSCLARDLAADEVVSMLDPGAAVTCVPQAALRLVTGRDTIERIPE